MIEYQVWCLEAEGNQSAVSAGFKNRIKPGYHHDNAVFRYIQALDAAADLIPQGPLDTPVCLVFENKKKALAAACDPGCHTSQHAFV